MRTEEVKIYKFDELDEKGKRKAREWFKEGYPDYEWWDDIFYIFIEKVKKYGINLDEKDINFSGFGSQGDGASFVCDNVDLDKFLEYTGIKIKHGLRKIFIDNTHLFVERINHHYYHESTVQANVYYSDIGYNDYYADYEAQKRNKIDKYLDYIAYQLCDKLDELKDALCNELYKDLESYYYDLLSDECIDDDIIYNEYEFYEDGTRY